MSDGGRDIIAQETCQEICFSRLLSGVASDCTRLPFLPSRFGFSESPEFALRFSDMGTIYFIQAGDDRGAIKIGWTSACPSKRLRSLASACPLPLRLLGTKLGIEKDEQRLHLAFGAAHLRGEWFDASDELLAFIRSDCSPVEARVNTRDLAAEWDGLDPHEWRDWFMEKVMDLEQLFARDRRLYAELAGIKQ
jgi:hypothetical protein